MHELAPLRLAASAPLEGECSAIATVATTDLAILHVKSVIARADRLRVSLGLPDAGCTVTIGTVERLWLGPAEWLLIAAGADDAQLAALGATATAQYAAVAPASDRFAVIELAFGLGQLAYLTGLAEANFASGRAVRTRLADIPVVIASGPDARVRMFLDRTYAPHFRAWLKRAT